MTEWWDIGELRECGITEVILGRVWDEQFMEDEPASRGLTVTNEQVHRRAFRGHAAELAAVRRFAAGALPHCPVRDDAVLLFDEVAANAIVHTDSTLFEVVLRHSDDVVRGEVLDAGAGTAPTLSGPPDGESEGGRGLQLVDLLAKQWGTSRTGRGRLVWFELHDPCCG